jgi:hypothetical protein
MAIDLLTPRAGAQGTPGALRAQWRARSAAGTWAFPDDWWCGAVDALIEALLDGRVASPAAEQLGRERAAAMVSLPESFDDLSALASLVGDHRIDSDLYRALAVGWADVTSSAQIAAGCLDPMTGLTTPAYLRTRLSEIYRAAQRDGADPGEQHALVVVAFAEEDAWSMHRSFFGVATQLITLHHTLSAVFSGDETLCATGPRVAVALVRRDQMLARRHAALRSLLDSDPRGVRTWIERLPLSLSSARELISELSR